MTSFNMWNASEIKACWVQIGFLENSSIIIRDQSFDRYSLSQLKARCSATVLTKLPTAYPEVISTKKKMVSITSKVMILASRSNFMMKVSI